MRSISRLTALGAMCLSLAASSCSEERLPNANPGGARTDATGAVGLQLQLAPGLNLDSANYTITGPGGFQKSGAIDLRNSSTLSVIVSGLPAGTGYTITINATVGDSGTTCLGSATFDVNAHSTTVVVVQVQCREPAGKGSVLGVDGLPRLRQQHLKSFQMPRYGLGSPASPTAQGSCEQE